MKSLFHVKHFISVKISLSWRCSFPKVDERRRRVMEDKIERKRMQAMKENDNKRRKLWILLARKEIPKV